MLKKHLFILVITLVSILSVTAQYSTAAGVTGSDAVHKDSSVFIGWAQTCVIERGYIKISDTTLTYEGDNKATHGTEANALGKADGSLVSLGDSGIAILTFDVAIKNGTGNDFAVFENALQSQAPPQNYFIELAFVEVSSDGKRFVRFPSKSVTPVSPQIATFEHIDPANIDNLAGKYVVNYGTPFDLEDIKDSIGIDLQNITHVKIIDVVGSIDTKYASYDSEDRIVNDPYPTPFATCGFDLDAVGVMQPQNEQTNGTNTERSLGDFILAPNPIRNGQDLMIVFDGDANLNHQASIYFYDITGQLIRTVDNYDSNQTISIEDLPNGIYFVKITDRGSEKAFRLLKQ